MMKILFITDKYFPKPYANAQCAQALIDAFIEMGAKVDVIAFKDSGIVMPKQYKGANIYAVTPDLRLQLFYYADNFKTRKIAQAAKAAAHFISKIKGIIMLPFWPLNSLAFPRRIFKKIEILYKKNYYDAIISIYGPFEGALALTKFKQKYTQVPCAIYAVDSTLRSGKANEILRGSFSDPFAWEKIFMETNNAFFYMQSRANWFEQERYRPYWPKLVPVDLPRLKFEDLTGIDHYRFGTEGENWVYAGSIGNLHYDSEKMFEYFLQLPREEKRTLHLFCRGAPLRVQQEVKHSQGRIVLHGYVDASTLKSVCASADVLVTMKTSNQISAKIFECISYCKPIVHFSGHPKDPNAGYYQQYPLAYVVRTYEDNYRKSSEKLLQFLKKHQGVTVSRERLKQILEKNTPEYSLRLLCEKLGLSNLEK